MGRINGFFFIRTFAFGSIGLRCRHMAQDTTYVVITEDSTACTFVRQEARRTDSYLPLSS